MFDKLASDAYAQGVEETLMSLNVPMHIKEAAFDILIKEGSKASKNEGAKRRAKKKERNRVKRRGKGRTGNNPVIRVQGQPGFKPVPSPPPTPALSAPAAVAQAEAEAVARAEAAAVARAEAAAARSSALKPSALTKLKGLATAHPRSARGLLAAGGLTAAGLGLNSILGQGTEEVGYAEDLKNRAMSGDLTPAEMAALGIGSAGLLGATAYGAKKLL